MTPNKREAPEAQAFEGLDRHTPIQSIYRPPRRFTRMCARRHARVLTKPAEIREALNSRGRVCYQVHVSSADGTPEGTLYIDTTMCSGTDFVTIFRAVHGGEL